MIEATCANCGKTFRREPNVILGKKQRFCSKRCWYDWNTGSNNWKSKRVTVLCDHCGKEIQKIPSRIGKLNYCNWTCSRLAHRAKISGERHVFWTGGSLASRGTAWDRIRMEIIVNQGGRCAHCGMSDADHRTKYGMSLNVHHKTLYRLTMDNDRDNLEALCTKCHKKADAANFKNLSEEQKSIIVRHTEQFQAIGKDIPNYSYAYNLCPQCGQKKAKKASLCMDCSNREARLTNPRRFCTICEKMKRLATDMPRPCRKCSAQMKRSPRRICPICGGPKVNPSSPHCRKCRYSQP